MSKALSILLVEDNAADQRLVREAFRNRPFVRNLKIVPDGIQALEYLRTAKTSGQPAPDLVVLDLNLPHKSGCEVLDEIKTDPELRSIPVAIFSSSDSPDDVRRCYNHFANCYLVKPTELEKFFLVLRALGDFWGTVAELSRH